MIGCNLCLFTSNLSPDKAPFSLCQIARLKYGFRCFLWCIWANSKLCTVWPQFSDIFSLVANLLSNHLQIAPKRFALPSTLNRLSQVYSSKPPWGVMIIIEGEGHSSSIVFRLGNDEPANYIFPMTLLNKSAPFPWMIWFAIKTKSPTLKIPQGNYHGNNKFPISSNWKTGMSPTLNATPWKVFHFLSYANLWEFSFPEILVCRHLVVLQNPITSQIQFQACLNNNLPLLFIRLITHREIPSRRG